MHVTEHLFANRFNQVLSAQFTDGPITDESSVCMKSQYHSGGCLFKCAMLWKLFVLGIDASTHFDFCYDEAATEDYR